MFLRALRVCDPEFLNDENKYIYECFTKFGYPPALINRALSLAKQSFFHPQVKADFDIKNSLIIPFIPDVKAPPALKLIYKYNNKIANNLSRNSPKNINSGVYIIPCSNCNQVYVGETGRDINVRIKEHKRDFCDKKLSSAAVSHFFRHRA